MIDKPMNLSILMIINSTKTVRNQTMEVIILVSQKLLEPKIMTYKLNKIIRQ